VPGVSCAERLWLLEASSVRTPLYIYTCLPVDGEEGEEASEKKRAWRHVHESLGGDEAGCSFLGISLFSLRGKLGACLAS
jgi:hypothetical protein